MIFVQMDKEYFQASDITYYVGCAQREKSHGFLN